MHRRHEKRNFEYINRETFIEKIFEFCEDEFTLEDVVRVVQLGDDFVSKSGESYSFEMALVCACIIGKLNGDNNQFDLKSINMQTSNAGVKDLEERICKTIRCNVHYKNVVSLLTKLLFICYGDYIDKDLPIFVRDIVKRMCLKRLINCDARILFLAMVMEFRMMPRFYKNQLIIPAPELD